MKTSIGELLKKYYVPRYKDDTTAVNKLFQEIVICSLSRLGFFEYFAINGNSALRLFYELDYNSSDLSFTLVKPIEDFNFMKYIAMLEKELASYGLKFDIYVNQSRENKDTSEEYVLYVYVEDSFKEYFDISISDKIRIDISICLELTDKVKTDTKYQLLPAPYEINIIDCSSLFAKNIFSLMDGYERSQIDVKSLYEYYYFVNKGTAIDREYLKFLMVNSKYINPEDEIYKYDIKGTIGKLFDLIDFNSAVDLILSYTNNFDQSKWNDGFFIVTIEMLKI